MDYDDIANEYQTYGKQAITDWVLGYSRVLQLLMPLKNKVVLDYGCGDGKFSRVMHQYGARVIGVDISRKMLNLARQNGTGDIQYHHIISGNLEFLKPSSFHCAVMNFVTCEISGRQEMIKIFKGLHILLKTGGCLTILNVNWDKSNGQEFISYKLDYYPKLSSGRTVTGILKSTTPIKISDYFWSQNDYQEILKESNFEIQLVDEPMVKNQDYNWINEDKFPPFLILVAKKCKL